MLTADMIEQLRTVSEQLAVSASANMEASVQHCPGWTVHDLVVHIGEVQRFWVRIVGERLTARPMDGLRELPEGVEPLEWFRSQTTALVSVLATCADDVSVWTWWEPQQNAAWVKRRQLNEVVVHAWDAANAVGSASPIPTDLAVVGLQEFVDVFARDLREGAEPPPVALVATDCDWSAVLFSGEPIVNPSAPVPKLELCGTASEVLLSLWGRSTLVDPATAAALGAIDLS
jgi:uncharacterized protein (TIGR03083 family)